MSFHGFSNVTPPFSDFSYWEYHEKTILQAPSNSASTWSLNFSTLSWAPMGSYGLQWAPIGGKLLGDVWFCFLFFKGILMPFRGFNYSKIVNYRFLIVSNTFWMDFGVSKCLTFLNLLLRAFSIELIALLMNS